MVVEDDEAIRETLRVALEMEGYVVFCAEDGREALETLPRIPRPCLILLDLMMPVMNGWELAEALAADEALATIPVVVVTAFADRAAKVKKARGLLKKPVQLDVLLGTVRQHCGSP